MSDIFDEEEENLNEDESFDNTVPNVDARSNKNSMLDARRRLEEILEEKRLRDELRDILDEIEE